MKKSKWDFNCVSHAIITELVSSTFSINITHFFLHKSMAMWKWMEFRKKQTCLNARQEFFLPKVYLSLSDNINTWVLLINSLIQTLPICLFLCSHGWHYRFISLISIYNFCRCSLSDSFDYFLLLFFSFLISLLGILLKSE